MLWECRLQAVSGGPGLLVGPAALAHGQAGRQEGARDPPRLLCPRYGRQAAHTQVLRGRKYVRFD